MTHSLRLTTLSLLTASAIPAFASTTMIEVDDQVVLPGFDIIADIADDMDVYDADGRKIGEVEDVVGPDRNTPEALAVEFEDELAEFGREDRIIPLSAFTREARGMVLADLNHITDFPIWKD